MTTPEIQECVVCGRPCRPHQRWCSRACAEFEDGPYTDEPDDSEEEDD